jgi:hypothetical protein
MSVAEIVDAYPTLTKRSVQGALRELAQEKTNFQRSLNSNACCWLSIHYRFSSVDCIPQR